MISMSRCRTPGERIFQSSTSNLNVQSGDALSTEETSVFGVWRHHDTEFHTLSFGTAPAYSRISVAGVDRSGYKTPHPIPH